MENISKHITYNEATHTSTGLENTPNEEQLQAMKLLAWKVFEPLREFTKTAIKINSFFRSKVVNEAVNGSSTSQHLKGEAIDIDATKDKTNSELFNWIKVNLDYDQLIWEGGTKINPDWIHVSYKKHNNRKQIIYKYN